ncbi:MAG: biotin transporter BioY [Thermoprotei archaeon]|nr:MAG: biotin transporter BioY [Thermoprotei archaeon]
MPQENSEPRRERLVYTTLSALFAALTAVFAQVKFYLGPVPYTMQNFMIMLAALVLKPKYAALSQVMYLALIGFGVPAAAGFKGGPQVLVGYTAGYLWMFPVSCYVMSYLSRKYAKLSSEELLRLSLKDIVSLLTISFISVLPIYFVGFLVFSHYTLQPTAPSTRLSKWSESVVSQLGFNPTSELVVLFVASVIVFIPQDLLVDHLLAIIVAPKMLKFMRKKGLRVP